MVKKNNKLKKNNSAKYSNLKKKIKEKKRKKKDKRIIRKKIFDKNYFITDLSFIDKYEEDEKKRIIIKEKENNIKNMNKKIFKLKLVYRPLTNNIELIGNYVDSSDPHNNLLINENINKCCYLLNQDNNIIAPIFINDTLNDGKANYNNKISDESLESNLKEKAKNSKKKKLSENKNEKIKKVFYFHICKKNLINSLLLNENSIINYIIIFLSGNYSGYFEENKNNLSNLKSDNFNILLNRKNSLENPQFHNFKVIGTGKDEYGEYIIKGEFNLIKNIEQYEKENNFSKEKNIINKVINLGSLYFHKIYNI